MNMFKKMKVAMLFVIVTVFIIGCSDSDASSDKTVNYPNKDVTLVVPFNPGGASDMHTRVLEKYFEDEFGHSLSFVYKPGAAGAVGTAEVAVMEGEDHTILAANYPDIIIQPLTESGSFSIDDFDYIAEVTNNPLILAANSDSDISTLEDFVEQAKANPGEMSVAYAPNSVLHIAMLDFMDQAEIDVTLVPYKDGPEAKSMIMGGHVDAAMLNLSLVAEELEKINALAATTNDDLDELDIPSFTSQGYDVIAELSRIYLVPKGLSDEQLLILRDGFNNIGQDEDYIADMEKTDQPVEWLTGEELEAKVREYNEYAKEIIEKHGLN